MMRMHGKASENHSRFGVKRIKSGSLWRGVLNICSLLNIPGSSLVIKKKLVFLHGGRERC